MNETDRGLLYRIEIMRRSHKPTWKYEWGAQYKGEAIEECGSRNRAWAAGEAIHRVIEVETGKEIYRRGYHKPLIHAASVERSQQLKGSH